ncbi:hypothetical protein [Actinomadura macrotermitis]|uniref:Uncharacterized protein n=1 Tax=Actinomadura macrotermitis TaxID=2585200 RepID=A0A7K0C613_9ACTN|nr:hypothetical protein [Actinomadura macrotermitis]MQY08899.1 hypothetical protein [Actinomadura macrotermitis]
MPPTPTTKKLKKRKKPTSDRTMSASGSSSDSDSDSRPGSAMSIDSDGPDTHSTPVRGSRPSPMDLDDDDSSYDSGTRIGPSDRTSFRAGAPPKRAWSDGSDSGSDGPARPSSAAKRVRVAAPDSDPQGKPADGPARPSTAGPSPSSNQSPGMAALTALIGPLPGPVPGPQHLTVAMQTGTTPAQNAANPPQPGAQQQVAAQQQTGAQQGAKNLNAFLRTDAARIDDVKYYPVFSVENGRVGSVNFGTTRTPSPFGAKMGDHTSSWAGVVDSIHAGVFGKTLDGAVQELRDRQDAADKWMDGPLPNGADPPVLKLWKMLDEADRNARHDLVQGYAFRVRSELDKADKIIKAAAAAGRPLTAAETNEVGAHLSEALGHHAAYRNMLPLATVPAAADRGSIGSGEGTHRNNVLAIDIAMNERRKDPNAPLPSADAVKKAGEGLHAMFSMSAATREARLGEALKPQELKKTKADMEAISRYTRELRGGIAAAVLPPTAANGGTGVKRITQLTTPGALKDLAEHLKKLTEEDPANPNPADKVTAFTDEHKNDPENALAGLARDGIWVVNELERLAALPKPPAGELNTLRKRAETLAVWHDGLDDVITRLSRPEADVRADTALMLAHMINDHQGNMATAYPEAVKATGFLQDAAGNVDPAAAAREMLRKYIADGEAAGTLKVEQGERDNLLAAFDAAYASLNHTPKIAADSRWVVGSRNTGLVVGIRNDVPMILGRAAAPPGIDGMGAHITAWKTETDAVKSMVEKVRANGGGDAEIIDRFKTETENDLKGKLMTELAPALPSGQLDKGQLRRIADAAYAVRAADTPEKAIQAYLTFRNVLPFATVDSGGRSGHGESRATVAKGTFDEVALGDEAALRAAAFARDAAGQITAAKEAIADLRTYSGATYNADPAFVQMIDDVAKKMDRKADILATGHKGVIKDLIFKTRKSEHLRVFNMTK